MGDDKTDVDGTLARRVLALQILEIANEARILALGNDRFHERDWLTIDLMVNSALLAGASESDALDARVRARWLRTYAASGALTTIAAQYRLDMATLFDRVAELHSPSKKLAA